MKKLFLIPLIMVLIAGLILSGCTTTKTSATSSSPPVSTTTSVSAATSVSTLPAGTPKSGGTLRMICNAQSSNLGWPADMFGGGQLSQPALETLVRGDEKGNVYPWLAKSYKIADDYKSVTFTLNQGIKFHDGSDFNAEVVKWNLDNMISASQQPNWASVDVLDNYTVRVNFSEWKNTLMASFGDTDPSAFMVSKTAYEKNGKDWMRSNPVGTGPFTFVSFQQDVSLKYVKNQNYWIKGKPYLDRLEYIFIADEMTQEMYMETGGGDIVNPVNSQAASKYTKKGLLITAVVNSINCLVPDTADADSPWANQKVREAAEYAIDREAIAKAFGYDYAQPVYQIPPRYTMAYDTAFVLGRKHDADKAKQLLAEAGYANGFETTFISASTANQYIMMAIQDYLSKVNIKVKLELVDGAKFGTFMGPGTWKKNSALYQVLPAIDIYFAGGLQFIFNTLGQSWQRTPEMKQAYDAAMSSKSPDMQLTRAASNMITSGAMIIPVIEDVTGSALMPYVMDSGLGERGTSKEWNPEATWLNK